MPEFAILNPAQLIKVLETERVAHQNTKNELAQAKNTIALLQEDNIKPQRKQITSQPQSTTVLVANRTGANDGVKCRTSRRSATKRGYERSWIMHQGQLQVPLPGSSEQIRSSGIRRTAS
jgi:hypothetical protein